MKCIICNTEFYSDRTNKCKCCENKINSERYHLNKERYAITRKLHYQDIKKEVFSYYGDKCNICGNDNILVLSLDHINGNGRKNRKDILGIDSGTSYYKWIAKNKPDYIRLLCYNCNCRIDMQKGESIRRNKYIDLKIEVFEKYGNKCSNCGESNIEYLTMDHIKNDGNEHRREIGLQIYPWLKRNSYPKDNFQILCFNCNYVKRAMILV